MLLFTNELVFYWIRVFVIVFNTTFNNISVITWRSVLVVAEGGVPGENLPQVTFKLYNVTNVVSMAPRYERDSNSHNFSGGRHLLHR